MKLSVIGMLTHLFKNFQPKSKIFLRLLKRFVFCNSIFSSGDVDEFLGDDVNVEFTMVGEVDHASTSEDGNDISEEIYIETASEFHLEAKLEKVTACSPNPNTNTVPDFSANTTDLEEIQAGLASSLKENTVTVCPKEEPALPIPLIEQNLETKNEVQQAYPCTECEFTAKNLKGLKKHKTCKHKRDLFIANKNADGFYECIKCPEPWKTKLKGKFAIHMRKHEGKAFICKKCSFETFSKLTLKNHKAIHVKRSKFIDKDKYKCDKCGYSTGYKRAFYDHLELHEGVEYKCNLCQYSSCSSHNLQKHMSRTHSTLKLYCDKCSYVAKTRELLTNHMKIHERKPANEIRFVCDKCEYKTHSRLNFKNHIETHGSVLHFCEKCVYSTPSSLYLKKHVYRQHTVQRYEPELGDPTTFECDQCNYTTSRDANLKVHIRRTHTLRLPDGALFKCQACNYRSKSYDSLGEHMKESHADNMPQTKHYACERCSYTTWDGGNLRIHMRKHATVCLPCSECNFTTDSAENMRAHTRRKHRDDPKKEPDI